MAPSQALRGVTDPDELAMAGCQRGSRRRARGLMRRRDGLDPFHWTLVQMHFCRTVQRFCRASHSRSSDHITLDSVMPQAQINWAWHMYPQVPTYQMIQETTKIALEHSRDVSALRWVKCCLLCSLQATLSLVFSLVLSQVPSLVTHHLVSPSPINYHLSPIAHHPSTITHRSSPITHRAITFQV